MEKRDPKFLIQLDPVLQIIRVTQFMVVTADDADRYIKALNECLTLARTSFGRAMLLADLRDAPVRSQEAADMLREVNEVAYRPGERVAVVVMPSMLSMQIKRNIVHSIQAVFATIDEAESWLTVKD